MAEQFVHVTPYGVNYVCDECGVGYMVFTKELVHDDPNGNFAKHRCTSCGHEQNFKETYPLVRYRLTEAPFKLPEVISLTKD